MFLNKEKREVTITNNLSIVISAILCFHTMMTTIFFTMNFYHLLIIISLFFFFVFMLDDNFFVLLFWFLFFCAKQRETRTDLLATRESRKNSLFNITIATQAQIKMFSFSSATSSGDLFFSLHLLPSHNSFLFVMCVCEREKELKCRSRKYLQDDKK